VVQAGSIFVRFYSVCACEQQCAGQTVTIKILGAERGNVYCCLFSGAAEAGPQEHCGNRAGQKKNAALAFLAI
jgi:hypothetical protein